MTYSDFTLEEWVGEYVNNHSSRMIKSKPCCRAKKSFFPSRPPLPRLLLDSVSCMRNAQIILRHVDVSIQDGSVPVL
ncbi:hypothetical protein SAY87_025590 [Trapa incisa]|uniref:Uncharacterized protein n=1 Tax=Trapa incisa TaxID=236973 RepID=A0AAN7GTM3_9MYRT|nr:hypothetical protein SAY87_025590 [Trapa incisa]